MCSSYVTYLYSGATYIYNVQHVWANINSGVPQSSVLGTLIYIPHHYYISENQPPLTIIPIHMTPKLHILLCFFSSIV